MSPHREVQVLLSKAARRRAAYQLWREGRLTLREALRFRGPVFNHAADTRISGGLFCVCVLKDNIQTEYMYPIADVYRIRVTSNFNLWFNHENT